jgi:hypothetical protein
MTSSIISVVIFSMYVLIGSLKLVCDYVVFFFLFFFFFFKHELNPLNLSLQYTWPKEKRSE